MRQWDVLTANRVDYFITRKHSSPHLALLPPSNSDLPVNIERFPLTSKQDFTHRFRLVSYKVSLIVRFQSAQEALV